MSTAEICEEWRRFEPIERWFRALDQRRIDKGTREWLLHVTGILRDQDSLWIQIADNTRGAGSVLLHVRASTSIDQAVHALKSCRTGSAYPRVVAPPPATH